MRSLTWQQYAALFSILAAVILAHRFGGVDVSMISSTVGVILAALFIKPGDGGSIPPLATILLGLALIVPGIQACKALSAVDAADVAKHGAQLQECEAEGRDAGSYRVYDACKKEAGIQ